MKEKHLQLKLGWYKLLFMLSFLFMGKAQHAQEVLIAHDDSVFMTAPGYHISIMKNTEIDYTVFEESPSSWYNVSLSWHDVDPELNIFIYSDGSIYTDPETPYGTYEIPFVITMKSSIGTFRDSATLYLTVGVDTNIKVHNDTIYLEAGGPSQRINFYDNDTVYGYTVDSILTGIEYEELEEGDETISLYFIYSDMSGFEVTGTEFNNQYMNAKICIPDSTILQSSYSIGYSKHVPLVYGAENFRRDYSIFYSELATIYYVVTNNFDFVRNDTFIVERGDVTSSIFVNDDAGFESLSGTEDFPFILIDEIPSDLTLNEDGTISVSEDIPVGTYQFRYLTYYNCYEPPAEAKPQPPVSIGTNSQWGLLEAVGGSHYFDGTLDFGDHETIENWDTALVIIVIEDPLSIDLYGFNVEKMGSTVSLDWRMDVQADVKVTNIQRSQDGQNWTTIGSISEKNSTGKYTYMDYNPELGYNYYRLEMNDHRDKSFYSIVKMVNFDQINSVKLYPNPATDHIYINGLAQFSQLRIYDYLGQEVYTQELGQVSSLIIDLSQWSNGLYILKLSNNEGDSENYKFSIVH